MRFAIKGKINLDDKWTQNITLDEIEEAIKDRLRSGMSFRLEKIVSLKVKPIEKERKPLLLDT